MAALFAAGGIPMFFIVAFGLIALVAAVLFAIRPDVRKVEAVKSLSIATVLSVFAGVASDFAAVGYNVPRHPEWSRSPNVGLIILEGFAESMSPAIFGFSMLAVVWMIMAVGHRRLRPQLAE